MSSSLRHPLLLSAAVLIAAPAFAQNAPAATQTSGGGRPITSADIRNWNSVRQSALSNDGKWFAYVVGSSESDATLILRGTAQNATEKRINVGNNGGSVQISGDSKWIGYLVNPPRPQAGRGGRGGPPGGGGGRGGARGGGAPGGAAPGGGGQDAAQAADSAPTLGKFVLMDLATQETREFERVRRFSFNADQPTWVVMQGGGAGGLPAAAGGGRGGRGGGPEAGGGGAAAGGNAPLILYNLATGERQTMGPVAQYSFNDKGTLLAYTLDNAEQLGNAVQLRDMTTGATRALESEDVLYRHLSWVDSSKAIAVMRGEIQTTGARDTVFSLRVFRDVGPQGAARVMEFTPAGRTDFPSGWKLASERAPRYSRDLSAVFFGIREGLRPGGRGMARGNSLVQPGAPGMGGTINQPTGRGGADSLPSLILWHGRDPRLQSQQMVQEAADRNFNYLVSYRFDDNRFVQLSDSTMRQVGVMANDQFAMGSDNREYQLEASYSGRNFADYYVVDLRTGARKLLWKKRLGGNLQPSPDGSKALFWGVDGHYWVMDLKTLDSVNITRGVPTTFVNTEADNNWLVPPAVPSRGWTRDNQFVLLYDNWDIWKVSARPGVAAVNLTGDGKRNQIRYRTIYAWTDEEEDAEGGGGGGGRGGRGGGGGPGVGIDLSKPMYIGTYGEWTKKEGVSRVDPDRPGAKTLVFEDARMAITKARNADVYAFTKQTFTEFPDWWVFNQEFQGAYKITDVNPQIKELAMSAGTRLVDYRSDKGDRLQAAMYLPANFEPGKKYPMLVTIYEKRSQNKNGFVNPSETQTPNARMYTSRGYIVLDPDIVYKINDPGMSAVWAVVPAVKAAIATGIVDEKNVGLWGHSWGGYQTAFLVTQTNIFKAAVAGAALTDMVSMYSSVYWNTGGANQAIFESSQGRFKGNFIDNYDAYIRNSPAFHAKKQTTPLMLLHNDKDGAVDFNQGITHFNTLRQLGKEVILLEYVGENHGVANPVNQRDYAQRMAEWFDHYLMGKPAPDWMKNGVPRLQITEHLLSRRDSAQRVIAQ